MQQPSQIKRLLETFIEPSSFLPADAYQIRDRDALRLQEAGSWIPDREGMWQRCAG